MKKRAMAMMLIIVFLTLCLQTVAFAITLKVGSTGENVKTVQRVLRDEGYDVTVDGIFGEGTEAAVKKYQKKYGLTADGIVGDATWAKMTSDDDSPSNPSSDELPLKKGSNGDNVKKVQNVLIKHGFDLTADGDYGETTASYVKKYQSMHNLSADGIVGDATWKSMMGKLSTSKTPDNGYPIEEGDEGYDVLVIQTSLGKHNLSCGTDGVFDSNVTAKVKKYQSIHGLTSDGIVGKDTWVSMVTSIKMPARPIKKAEINLTDSRFPITKKSDKDDIKAVQSALSELGYDIDMGKYNSRTTNAIKDYQKKNGLKSTGKVDMDTWEALVATAEDKENVILLAKIIKRESNDSDNGQMAVANTVMAYAEMMDRSVKEELQSGRYSPCSNWSSFLETSYSSTNLKNAKRVYYGGQNPFGDVKPYYFHSKSYTPASGSWWTKMPCIGLLDGNIYYSKK